MDVQSILSLLAYVPVAFMLLFVAKLAGDRLLGSADHAIEEQSNLAEGLRRAGYYIAVTLGLYGVLASPSSEAGLAGDLLLTTAYGAWLIGMILVAAVINNRVVLRGVNNRAEIAKGNVAVGIVEFASYLATGFVALNSFAGEGGGLITAMVFFLLGQLALVTLVALYEKITPFNALGEIADGNAAAGLMVGGMMVALGIVLSAALSGDFSSWGPDLAAFGLSALVGIAALLLVLKPIDWLFLPNTDFQTEIVRDRNVEAIATATGVQIAIALVVTAIFV